MQFGYLLSMYLHDDNYNVTNIDNRGWIHMEGAGNLWWPLDQIVVTEKLNYSLYSNMDQHSVC